MHVSRLPTVADTRQYRRWNEHTRLYSRTAFKYRRIPTPRAAAQCNKRAVQSHKDLQEKRVEGKSENQKEEKTV